MISVRLALAALAQTVGVMLALVVATLAFGLLGALGWLAAVLYVAGGLYVAGEQTGAER